MMIRLLGLIVVYMAGIFGWVGYQLGTKNPRAALKAHKNEAPAGETFRSVTEHDAYTVTHVVVDGIERVTYTPKDGKHDTPIVFQHGMFHTAWCWGWWQAALAERGWESHAHSLPGHGKSPLQRRIMLCTLDYYLGFVAAEIERMPRKPVLVGHSMGGALTQWYLKYVGDDLPGAVLVAPWPSHSVITPQSQFRFLRRDPLAGVLQSIQLTSNSWIRTPQRAYDNFLAPGAVVDAEMLHANLGPESALILFQHTPVFWQPPQNVNTPLMWIACETDVLISVAEEKASADFYGAEYYLAPDAPHNVMMAHNHAETLQQVEAWLTRTV